MPRLPIVAIVGRPNVGKSTLFNRLVGRRVALVDDRPGVTRDRREGEASLLGLEFRVMDTAGYEDEDAHTLPGRMRQQTEAAVREADVALFLIDGREGLTPLDEEIARWLRAEKTPVIVAANKAEGNAGESGRLEAYTLGFGEPIAISAEHGEGRVDLFESLRPFVERGQSFAAINKEESDVRLAYRRLGLLPHPAGQGMDVLILISGSVHHPKLESEQTCFALAPVARDAGTIVHQRHSSSDKTVEERRLAHVGASDNRDDGQAGHLGAVSRTKCLCEGRTYK